MSQPNSFMARAGNIASASVDLLIPVLVVVLFVLVGTLWRSVETKQDAIVMVNYERLTQLFTAETVRRDLPEDENLGGQTAIYLTAVNQVAGEFAETTGTIVVMAEAIVATDGEVQDITDLIHLRAMERVRDLQ